MLFPWLAGFRGLGEVPATWCLVLLNVFMFLMTSGQSREQKTFFEKPQNLMELGKLYSMNTQEGSGITLQSDSFWMIQGSKALKDPEYIESVKKGKVTWNLGDQVRNAEIKKEVIRFSQELEKRHTFLYGLSSVNQNSLGWVTYQFTHAGWLHLTGNMGILLFFATIIELKFGSVFLLMLYLLSGFTAGWAFLVTGVASLAPVVGASGSLTGVMAFFLATEVKKYARFFYFISPIQGYFGFIYLPVIFMVPLLFVPDLVGYLSTPEEFGTSVAYSAHLGGAAFGLVAGLIYRFFLSSIIPPERIRDEEDSPSLLSAP
ncbi:MAG: rhomboid family intramembrane serine protease [Pseudobdellovibrionaceae bacterium]|jgi:membrane associated rhomboid family serine protease|nr:rhomboid family intramembrane serine protease [Pseudomonadota bacterium]